MTTYATGGAPAHRELPSPSGCTTGFKVYGSLFKVDARYQFLNPLGKGSYGIVCAAKDKETGQCVAIKKVSPMAKRTVDAKHTLREILLLQFLGKHSNIISIHNLSTNLKEDELYIVMDLMDTDMHRVIQSSQPLSESHVKYFLHQLLHGVKYLHDNGVLHRDLKPGNLLLTKNCQLKIADFGLARKVPKPTSLQTATNDTRPRSAPATSASSSSAGIRLLADRAPMTEHVVTRWYRAPELMLQPDGLYDSSVDMWSIGCIFAEILGRKALFPGKNFLHQLSLIFEVIGTPPPEATMKIKSSQAQRFIKSLGKKPRVPFKSLFPNASDEAIDLLDRLLEFDPDKRISAKDALMHPYLQAIEKKYKTVDPHPSMRIDFSFDQKKLTKMDLRALIVKEVEAFRKSVAHTAALDQEDEEDRDRKKEKTVVVSSQPQASASASSSSSSSRVMCGSAGISMMHSALRQQQQQQLSQSSAVQQPPPQSIVGVNRQRIRVMSKPPVPRQQPPVMTTSTTNQQQDSVKVSATGASVLFTSTKEPAAPSVTSSSSNQQQPLAILPPPASTNTDQLVLKPPTTADHRSLVPPLRNHSLRPESSSSDDDSDSNSPPQSPPHPSDDESHRIQKSLMQSLQSTSTKPVILRRAASAGPTRKPLVPEPTSTTSTTTVATVPALKPTEPSVPEPTTHGAFVGSTTSLIRAQRLQTGQSLAESANSMLARIQETAPKPETNAVPPVLKPQRSTSNLDPKKPNAKRLTVPKSPKFSVMSWQKKTMMTTTTTTNVRR